MTTRSSFHSFRSPMVSSWQRRVTWECDSSSTDIPKATTVRFVRGVGQWLRSVASVLADGDFFYPSSGKDLDDSVIKDACRSSLLACVRGVFWRRCVKPTRLMEAAGSSMVRWWLGEKALFLWLSGSRFVKPVWSMFTAMKSSYKHTSSLVMT